MSGHQPSDRPRYGQVRAPAHPGGERGMWDGTAWRPLRLQHGVWEIYIDGRWRMAPVPDTEPGPPPSRLGDQVVTARAAALQAAVAELTAGRLPMSVAERAALRTHIVIRAEHLEAWVLRPVDQPPTTEAMADVPTAQPATIPGGLPDVED